MNMNGTDHFASLRGITGGSQSATCDDRAQYHIGLAMTMLNDEPVPDYNSDAMRQTAELHIPEIIADLLAYGDRCGIDPSALITKARELASAHS
jgi:hypothetical protein